MNVFQPSHFEATRTNMVDSQIHTMGVVSEPVLDAFRTVPRELFVPDNMKGIAYCDEDLPVMAGRVLMEPVTHARLVQAAEPAPGDAALDIGGATGYSAAILSRLVNRVVACEPEATLLKVGESIWRDLGYGNILPHQGGVADGCSSHGPYNLIFVNGSMAEVPRSLTAQLAPHGRLVCVVRKEGDRIGRAVLMTKNAEGVVSDRVLFDAAVPYLPGQQPRKEFVF